MAPRRVASALGLASLAMGTAMFAPARAARLFGLGHRPALMVAIAVRDAVVGLGLLISPRPALWLRLQALADVMDATIVATGLARGSVATRRGLVWLVAAIISAWAAHRAGCQLDATQAFDSIGDRR